MKLNVGDRVYINANMVEREGTIFFIDYPNIYNHEFLPIQVELDYKPQDGITSKMIRGNIKEITKIEDGVEDMNNNEECIEIWADGSSSNNKTRCGGWGYVLMYKEHKKEGCGGLEDSTNQQMEIQAVSEALKQIKKGNKIPIKVYSDSAYVINCFNDEWYKGWIKNGWKNSKKKPVANKEFWEELIALVQKQENISFNHVKGHSGVMHNEYVDDLAVRGRHELEIKLGLR